MEVISCPNDLTSLLSMTPASARLLFTLNRSVCYKKPETDEMANFFFRNLIAGNQHFEVIPVISTNSNVELVTANLDDNR